jgi:hypothetical protein
MCCSGDYDPGGMKSRAGSQALMAAAQECGYDSRLVTVLAALGIDKRDYLYRSRQDLGASGGESMCLDYRNVWGPGILTCTARLMEKICQASRSWSRQYNQP